MTKTTLKQLFNAKKEADSKLSAMEPEQKSKLERKWDIEHAYYSSVLEGSRIDKKEFELLAKDIK